MIDEGRLLLVAVGVLLWLADKAVPLCRNECLIAQGPAGWTLAPQTPAVTVLNRGLVLPLTGLSRPLRRYAWQVSARAEERPDSILEMTDELAAPTRGVQLALLMMAVVVLVPGADRLLWIVLPSLLVAQLWLVRRAVKSARARGVATERWLSLAVSALLCPPCALNLTQRLQLLHPLPTSALDWARTAMEPAAFQRLIDCIDGQVAAEIAWSDEAGARYAALCRLRASLDARRGPPSEA